MRHVATIASVLQGPWLRVCLLVGALLDLWLFTDAPLGFKALLSTLSVACAGVWVRRRRRMTFYPSTLKAILIHIEALEAETKIRDMGTDGVPYMDKIRLQDNEQTDYGWLVNEADTWAWKPPGGGGE